MRSISFLEKGRTGAVAGALLVASRPAHDLGPAGEQEMQLKGKAEHPLAQGLFRQHLVDQQRRAFGHTPCAATRTEAAMFAALAILCFLYSLSLSCGILKPLPQL